MSDTIVEYIRDNRDRYTREAITATLIDAGHDPAAVEAAWSRFDTPPDGTASGWPAGVAPPTSTGGAAGFIKVYTILILLVGAIVPVITVVQNIQYAGEGIVGVETAVASVVGAAIYVGLGYLLYRLISGRADATRPGVGWALAAGCLVPVVVWGVCIAATVPAALSFGGL